MTLTRKIILLPHIPVVRARIRSNRRMRDVAIQIRDNEGYCNTRNGGPIACISCPFDYSRRICRQNCVICPISSRLCSHLYKEEIHFVVKAALYAHNKNRCAGL